MRFTGESESCLRACWGFRKDKRKRKERTILVPISVKITKQENNGHSNKFLLFYLHFLIVCSSFFFLFFYFL